MSDWRQFDSTSELDSALAQHLAQSLASDVAANGSASIAVSGGGTPAKMFRALSACELDWSKVYLTLVDERCVPTDHHDSNGRNGIHF